MAAKLTAAKPTAAKRKERIPLHVKEEVWKRFGGSVCWCCQSEAISAKNKHFGHIVAEANGGRATVDNLRPVCPSCNLRMRTKNMYDFMVEEGYPLRDVAAVERVLSKDPGLAAALKGRVLFAIPTITEGACPLPDYDFVLVASLYEKYPFLRAVHLSRLFENTKHKEITFFFVMRPEYVRWVRHQQEAEKLKEIEKELLKP